VIFINATVLEDNVNSEENLTMSEKAHCIGTNNQNMFLA